MIMSMKKKNLTNSISPFHIKTFQEKKKEEMEHPQFGKEHLPKTYNYVILNGARLNVFLWRSLFSWLTTVALPWAAEAPRWLKWTKI